MGFALVGIGFVILGFVMFYSSFNKFVEIETAHTTNRIMKRLYGDSFNTKKPNIFKTIFVYLWHYSGYLFTALGAGILINVILRLF